MSTETTKHDWNKMKDQIKGRFGKLTDESIESVKGNMELLSEKIQHVYGYAKDKADKELEGFKGKLHAATEPKKQATTELDEQPTVEGVEPSNDQEPERDNS